MDINTLNKGESWKAQGEVLRIPRKMIYTFFRQSFHFIRNSFPFQPQGVKAKLILEVA